MQIKQIIHILIAITVSIMAGFAVRPTDDDSCTRAALDAVLDGGHLTLAEDCVLIVSPAAEITGDVTIEGGMLHSNGVDRILIVSKSGKLALRNTSVLSGASQIEPAFGGGILNHGELSIRNSRIVANSAQQGGGIYNTGRLFIHHSEIARNRAREGGGIYNLGLLVVVDSLIEENTALYDGDYGGYGAGIANKATATITRAEITGNRGDGEGIGIDNSGTLLIRKSIISGNHCISDDCRATGLMRYSGTVDARHNYWGSTDGPGEEGNGSGDGVIGLDPDHYQPFLIETPAWKSD